MKLKLLLEHTYSSTQIDIPIKYSGFIYNWGLKNIPNEYIYNKDDHGRQSKDDIHCTILYGLLDEKPDKIMRYLKNYGDLKFKLDKVSLFKNDENYDVVIIKVISKFLSDLHYELKDEFDNECKFPKYKPHITVAYVKKDTCDHLNNDNTFENKKFVAKSIQFSSINNTKTKIKL